MKFLQKIMISCKRATFLTEKKQVVGLSIFERWQLASHMTICKGCKHYERQSFLINDLVKNFVNNASHLYTKKEIEELKAKILKKLDTQK